MAWKRPVINVTSDINVTPLVDVMLVLLIIFMVITPLMQNHLNVQLARTQNSVTQADADKEDAIIVAVTHDGRFYLGNDMVTTDEITQKVSDLISNRLDKIVYIRADARAQYKGVVQVVDAVRDAGVDNVAMLTEKVETDTNPPRPPNGSGGE